MREASAERGRTGRRSLSAAERFGACALCAAALVTPWSVTGAVSVLSLFLIVCGVMPFLPTESFFFPVICRGVSHRREVCLSFDDGPDPETTKPLLLLLRREGVAATFFVNGNRAAAYPDLIAMLIEEGHEIGNHSYTHDCLIMFRSVPVLVREIEMTQDALAVAGVVPKMFRPPVGILTPRYAPALHQTAMTAVTFSCRGGDMGNRRVKGLADRILAKVRPGDIIMLHDIEPRQGDVMQWLEEMRRLIAGLRERGLRPVSMARLTNRCVMERNTERDASLLTVKT